MPGHRDIVLEMIAASGLHKVIVLACAGYVSFRHLSLKGIQSRSQICSKLCRQTCRSVMGTPHHKNSVSFTGRVASCKQSFYGDARSACALTLVVTTLASMDSILDDMG